MLSVNIATQKSRKDILPKCLNSLLGQSVPFDVIRVYCNDYERDDIEGVEFYWGEDLTDRAKFHFVRPGEIYFTCDDDLLYPPDYVETTLSHLKKYPSSVITYHGRKLQGKGLNYYFGHTQYHCLGNVDLDTLIDIPGSGVSAFNTDRFIPEIGNDDKMADVLLGLEAAKKGVSVVCAKHTMWWFKSLSSKGGIYEEQNRKCERQGELCDEIWGVKNSK